MDRNGRDWHKENADVATSMSCFSSESAKKKKKTVHTACCRYAYTRDDTCVIMHTIAVWEDRNDRIVSERIELKEKQGSDES